MPLEDGPFPCGRIYIYIVRCDDQTLPFNSLYLSYSKASKIAFDLAEKHNKQFHVDVYEESFNHEELKLGHTYTISEDLESLFNT